MIIDQKMPRNGRRKKKNVLQLKNLQRNVKSSVGAIAIGTTVLKLGSDRRHKKNLTRLLRLHRVPIEICYALEYPTIFLHRQV
jgi:hypothetical protein